MVVGSMDLRSRTALFCAALAFAIALSVVLRGRARTVQVLFAGFAFNLSLWYMTQALFGYYRYSWWERATELLLLLLPQLAVRLFGAIVPRRPASILPMQPAGPPHDAAPKKRSLPRLAGLLGLLMAGLVLSPYHRHDVVRAIMFVYFGGITFAALWMLDAAGRASGSVAVQSRVRFLVVVGALATAFSLADFLWWVGAHLPPVGAVLSIVFLFALSQSLQSQRLLDLYDLAGRLLVATALAFCLAGIFFVFITWVGGFQTMYLNAVLASIAILVLFNPLQTMVEGRIHQLFFRERFDLKAAIDELRHRLNGVFDTREMSDLVLDGLEGSRRVTAAAIFLRDYEEMEPGGAVYVRTGHVGDPPISMRIEEASSRLLLDRLVRPLSAEDIERELSEALDLADVRGAAQLRDAYSRLVDIGGGTALPVRGDDGELLGIVTVDDDRVRDAFSPDEVTALAGLAGQVAMVIENSRAYARIKERDRLTALGAMSAGLAHEVKNPLGAIKGAAQLLAERETTDGDAVFVGIILEEVDRLDRVVSSILDYSRQRTGEVDPIDINAAVQRTMQILAPAHDDAVELRVDLEPNLPHVRIDAEQLRQVLMNLVTNAIQAMGGNGSVAVATGLRRAPRPTWPSTLQRGAVEVRVSDTGPGISTGVLKNLFIPFFTTKSKGTGLGLAISQRIVQNAGGAIDVSSTPGVGSTFTVVLPVANPEDIAPAVPSKPRSGTTQA